MKNRDEVQSNGLGRSKPRVQDGASVLSTVDGTSPRGEDVHGDLSLPSRLGVAKTYKMYVGGAFVRSESGRYFQQKGAGNVATNADASVVNIPLGSRKDVRDAVSAAKAACEKWASRTAYNRGQILYRLAETLEGRRAELVASLERGGLSFAQADTEVQVAVDRCVYYAGFCDKVASLLASSNPVPGPHFAFSVVEPMGVVGVLAPQRPVLLGLVSTILPIVASGNTVVVVASEEDPRTAIAFCECVATSDVPGGVVNVLTGRAADLGAHLASHREVAGIHGVLDSESVAKGIAVHGAEGVKRIHVHPTFAVDEWLDESMGQGLSWIERFVETKSVWHPMGT